MFNRAPLYAPFYPRPSAARAPTAILPPCNFSYLRAPAKERRLQARILPVHFLRQLLAYKSKRIGSCHIKTAPSLQTVLFAGRKRYFQPKAWLKIQSVPAMEMKNKPKPTGLPQLNHEPHERQCFKWSS